MKVELSTIEFDLFRELLLDECGIELVARKSYLVETRLRPLLDSHGFKTYLELYQASKKLNGRALRNAIVDQMTTNETLWFRDPGPWEVLEKELLPEMCRLLSEGRVTKVRIWSAACSTGQEPYSVAMTILEYLDSEGPPGAKAEAFSILATDISPSALFVAMSGRYDQLAASRGLETERQNQFFETDGSTIVVRDAIKKMVRFESRNLAEAFSESQVFDLVLCRNVLIYLSDEIRGQIIQGIEESLKPGGALILGGAESLVDCQSNLETRRVGSSLYYGKRMEDRHE